MSTVIIVLLPLFFLVGLQVGREIEHKQMEEIRESVTKSWLQACDWNLE